MVTIAIPTYNRAGSYLKQTLDSALKQTYRSIEIIVADNCSSDDTEGLVAGMNAPTIQYFKHQTNVGQTNNFNFCLNRAKGEYFLLLHDDDLIDPDFVEACMRAAEPNYDAGIIRSGTRVIDANGQVISESQNRAHNLQLDDFFLAWFRNRTSMYLCSTLFNTKRLMEIGGFSSKPNRTSNPHHLFQDVVAEVQLAARFGQIGIPDVKASFRSHGAELTYSGGVKIADWCEDSLQLLDLMCLLSQKDKKLMRRTGMKFFANLNYRRAAAVRSRLKRIKTHVVVFHKFQYQHIPPSFYKFSSARPIYRRVFGHSR